MSNQEKQEICFDFKSRRVEITSYSLKTNGQQKNYRHLKNWVVEVSNDNQSWEEIDRHENYSGLNGPNFINAFKTKEMRSFCRFIRLRQIGKNWYDDYMSAITSIEFYGKLKYH